MSVTHTVLFQFKATASPDDVKAVGPRVPQSPPSYQRRSLTSYQACSRFLSLKDGCLHPTHKEAYIKSLKGGKDNSPEGLQVRRLTVHLSSSVLRC
jgi:hypothetical protein